MILFTLICGCKVILLTPRKMCLGATHLYAHSANATSGCKGVEMKTIEFSANRYDVYSPGPLSYFYNRL